MIATFAIVVFIAQGMALGIDEFVFHRARGLPRWERWGHPVDTLSVLFCVGFALVLPAQQPWVGIYSALAIVSCLSVTKDEWIHASICKPAEQWLHAVLFLLHPILLWSVFSLWQDGSRLVLLKIESLLAGAFMLYQIVYWNFWRNEKA